MRTLLAGLALTTTALAAHPVFTVQDDRIDEASGLVDLGDLSVVTNDSGDSGRLFVLDGDGRTVGVTDYDADATDVEALAPAGPSSVWVGDIGDNDAERSDVVVRRVTVGRGARTVRAASYRLTYPDGAHDAETLLCDPASGRLYLVTKSVRGGMLYAAPERLGPGENRLSPVGRVPVWATDGSFSRDGSTILVRGYATLSILAFPSLDPVASYELPEQQQGESLSVGPGGRVRIGTEGENQDVLELTIPARPSAAPTASATPPRTTSPAVVTEARSSGHSPLLVGGVIALALLAGGVLGRRARRRRR